MKDAIVVVDDMDRENEGDFNMAADLATIIRYSSGASYLCGDGEGRLWISWSYAGH